MNEIVRMANDIATFHSSFPEDEAKQMLAEHLNKFWAPPLRTKFFEQLAADPTAFHPLAVASASMIKCNQHNPIKPVFVEKGGTGG